MSRYVLVGFGLLVFWGAACGGSSAGVGAQAAGGAGDGAETASCDALACEDGELRGTFRFVNACPAWYPSLETVPPGCDPIQTHDENDGTLTFNADGTVTRSYTHGLTQYRLMSPECVTGFQGADYLSDAMCATREQPETQTTSATVCRMAPQARCRCDWTVKPTSVSTTEPYERNDYCLQGNELSFAIAHYVDPATAVSQDVTAHLVRVR